MILNLYLTSTEPHLLAIILNIVTVACLTASRPTACAVRPCAASPHSAEPASVDGSAAHFAPPDVNHPRSDQTAIAWTQCAVGSRSWLNAISRSKASPNLLEAGAVLIPRPIGTGPAAQLAPPSDLHWRRDMKSFGVTRRAVTPRMTKAAAPKCRLQRTSSASAPSTYNFDRLCGGRSDSARQVPKAIASKAPTCCQVEHAP